MAVERPLLHRPDASDGRPRRSCPEGKSLVPASGLREKGFSTASLAGAGCPMENDRESLSSIMLVITGDSLARLVLSGVEPTQYVKNSDTTHLNDLPLPEAA